MRFFSIDSRFSQIMMKVCYAAYLNALWLACCIPIVTIGASTAALYDVSLRIIRDEECYVGRHFFRAFRNNFRQATVIWLIMLGAGLFLAADGYIVYHLRASSTGRAAVVWTLILALIISASVVYAMVLFYVFPLIASVRNTNRAMIVNAFLIGTHYLFATIMVFAVHFAMFFAIVRIFTPLIIFGEGACALLSSWLINNILILCSYNPDGDDETEEDEPEEVGGLPDFDMSEDIRR